VCDATGDAMKSLQPGTKDPNTALKRLLFFFSSYPQQYAVTNLILPMQNKLQHNLLKQLIQ